MLSSSRVLGRIGLPLFMGLGSFAFIILIDLLPIQAQVAIPSGSVVVRNGLLFKSPDINGYLKDFTTIQLDQVYAVDLKKITILVDDFAPQPPQEQPFWPHNRLGGDRGPLNMEQGQVEWGQGVVTATITETVDASTGVWSALNHPLRDHMPLDFSAIFPAQILPQYQGRITDLRFQILSSTPSATFSAELRAQNPPLPEVVKWSESAVLNGGAQTLTFTLPLTLSQIQNLNWQVKGNAGNFVAVDRVELLAEMPHLDTPDRAFLWSYGMLLANWDPASGLTRDSAGFAANEFDNISASGMQAAAAVLAWRLGFISEGSAKEIVTKTTEGLLALPNCHGVWPHFVKEGQIVNGTEWSSIDSVIAWVALIEARQALGLDTTAAENVLTHIDWDALILGNGSISHGYVTDCSERLEDKDGGVAGGWKDFGTESWLVNLGYAAATGKIAAMDSQPPTYNGSGFIDELAWLLVPTPTVSDTFGIDWPSYREQAANCQLNYYQSSLQPGCLYQRDQSFYEETGLFGLSAAEVPDLSIAPVTQTYQAFGIGGVISPNNGSDLLGHAVIVPHYAGLAASLRPTEANTLWKWLEDEGLFSPLNNVENLMCTDEPTCSQLTWNMLKGSWNLSLQTLGWGRLLAGSNHPLYQAMWANDTLRSGYITLSQVCDYGPTNPISSASHNLDDTAADWGIFCEGLPLWAKENVTAPALDGRSLRCALTGGEAYSNVHCYRNLPPGPTANVFTLTLTFQFTPTTACNNEGSLSVAQALEFSISKWQTGKRYELALQWQNVGSGGPQWRYWDPGQLDEERWQPFTPSISQCLTGETWHTLTLTGEIVNDEVHYQSFVIDQNSYSLDIAVPAAEAPDEPDRLAVAVQLDGNAAQTPYEVFIDQVSFVRWPKVYLPLIFKTSSQ